MTEGQQQAPDQETLDEIPAAADESVDEQAAPEAESELEPEPEPEKELNPLEQARAEAEKWRDTALRSQAELENFRKRMSREKSETIKYGNAALIESLLPVIDNFNFGLQAAKQESEESVVFQGMSMVFKQLQDFLADQGVVEIPAEGVPFDPNVHEAVQQTSSDEVAEGRIISVIRRGFKMYDRLIRAANVVVSTGPAPVEETSADETGDAQS